MTTSKKTSVRAGGKAPNKPKTSRRVAPDHPHRHDLAGEFPFPDDGPLHQARLTRGDGKLVTVTVPRDQPEVAEPEPAPASTPAEPNPEPAPAATSDPVATIPATLAQDAAAEPKPAKGRGKGAKAVHTATSAPGAGKSAGKPAKPAKAPKTAKTPKPAKDKRLSCLDAAALVLAKSGTPMKAVDMVAAMEAKGLWKTGKGLTPEATLYAAIIREIAAKGKASRFTKHDRGLFTAAATTTTTSAKEG